MLLSAEPDLSVVGEADCGQIALDLAKSLNPDVILMDGEMPELDGVITTTTLHHVRPEIGIIWLSVHDDKRTQARAREAGAAAFIAKTVPPESLLSAIRQIAHHCCDEFFAFLS